MNEVVDAVSKIETGGDPLLESVKWIVLSVLLVMGGVAATMQTLRKFNSNRALDARDSAESSLFSKMEQRLKTQEEQINALQSALESTRSMHADLTLKYGQAMVRIEKIEQYEAVINELKQSLSRKEKMLDDKDADLRKERDHNRELTTEISRLKDRVAELEARLSKDEAHLRRIQPHEGESGYGR